MNWKEQVEPAAGELPLYNDIIAGISVAISKKRQADAFERIATALESIAVDIKQGL